MIGSSRKKETALTLKTSTSSIFQGVPPSKCPAFKSWIRLPETQQAQQTTEATPSTAATPPSPVAPIAIITSAAITSAQSVSPETG